MKFIDEEPEAREEREARERRHPHVLRLTDGELDIAKQLVAYTKARHLESSVRLTAMEQDDLTGLEQALEDA